jgi:VWFA-related protein
MSRLAILALTAAMASVAAPWLAGQESKPQSPPQGQASQAPPPSAETPQFPAQVEMVVVDIVVSDKKGSSVSGLTAEDFELTEDGRRQTIASFEAIGAPPAPTGQTLTARPRVSTNTAPEVRTGRSFVIVFDDMNITPYKANQAKGAVASFLKNSVREGDRVMLVATSGSTWWSTKMEAGREEMMKLLKRLDGRHIPDTGPDRMTDHEAMRIHIYKDTIIMDRVARRFESYGVTAAAMRQSQEENRVPGTGDPYVEGRATEVYYRASSRIKVTLDVVERLLDSMAPVKGRKSMILVSEGFIFDPNIDEFRQVHQASRRGNTAVYFIDVRGLEGMPMGFTAEFGPPIDSQDIGAMIAEQWEATEGAENLADETGGFTVKNTNDLGGGLQRIADETQSYYLLGYHPTNTARDGKVRKIGVKVAQKSVQVRARKGYWAPAEGPAAARVRQKAVSADADIQVALDSPYEVDAIPLRMTSFVFDETLLGKAKTIVATDVDLRSFAFEEQDGRLVDAIEFLLVVSHRETGEFFRYDQKVDMKLQRSTRERMNKTWFPIAREFDLSPGGYQAKIVVRDQNSRRVGTVIHDFEVPSLTDLRVSTPVLSDTLQPPSEDDKGVRTPLMKVDLTFPTRGMLLAQFEVYGASKDKAKGMPRVSSGYTIKRSDGVTLAQLNPTVILPTSLGKVSRLVGIPIENAAPGDYEFILTVKDEIADKDLEVRERFTLVAADGS